MGLKLISIFFGSPDVFRLWKEPINSLSYERAYMRAYVRTFVPVLQPWLFDIFFNFLHEVVSPYDLDDHQKFFWSKNFLTPKMAKKFLVFLAYIFQTPL